MDGNATISLHDRAGGFATMAAAHWPAAATSFVVVLVTWLIQSYFKKDALASIPIVGDGSVSSRRKQFVSGDGAWKLHKQGYEKFKGGIYRMATGRSKLWDYLASLRLTEINQASENESIVVSPKFLPELKKLPDDVLSFAKSISESMQSKYTKIKPDVPSLPHTIRASLTPALRKPPYGVPFTTISNGALSARLNATIADEVIEAMATELPQTGKWEEVNINQKLLRIVATASGRVFVGPELCRDKAYLDAAINYTVDLMIAVHVINSKPVWLRPLLAPFLPPVRKLKRRIKEADAFLRPVVAARIKAAEEEGYEKPDDMLQWLIDSQEKFGPKEDRELAEVQLGVTFAAIHTTTLTTTNAFYTLAAKPELIPMLREDVQQALVQSNGQFTSLAMQNMKKLDSFLKETMRHYPLGTSSFQRMVLKPITLSNGQVIPPGFIIEVPAHEISKDPEIFPEPEEFDALRFYKLREAKHESQQTAAEVVAGSQFVGVTPSSLTFGYGRHACPGRFFAANEIKMIMATALVHYEVKNPDGVVGRHPNKRIGQSQSPDSNKTIMVRKL